MQAIYEETFPSSMPGNQDYTESITGRCRSYSYKTDSYDFLKTNKFSNDVLYGYASGMHTGKYKYELYVNATRKFLKPIPYGVKTIEANLENIRSGGSFNEYKQELRLVNENGEVVASGYPNISVEEFSKDYGHTYFVEVNEMVTQTATLNNDNYFISCIVHDIKFTY